MRTHQYSAGSKGERLIAIINNLTQKWNKDNISRTKAYFNFYRRHPEVKWSFLASMVSRNAGWHMCDLESPLYRDALSGPYRQALFMAYEKANYLIFRDAFPQLLLYHYSTYLNSNLFHYMGTFSVSSFMEEEWGRFWEERDEERLMISLIINEQNLIQESVIEDGFLQNVFGSRLFYIQDKLQFSMVAFPTLAGELFGATVHHFKKLDARIQLGKRLAKILFSDNLYPEFYRFAAKIEHTGSRSDYEKYMYMEVQNNTPFLRMTYPVKKHPEYRIEKWDEKRMLKKSWSKSIHLPDEYEITRQYTKKRNPINLFLMLKSCLRNRTE